MAKRGTINVLFTLQDKYSQPLKKLGKTTYAVKEQVDKFRNSTNKLQGALKNLSTLSLAVSGNLLKMFKNGVLGAASFVKSLINVQEMMDLAKVQYQIEAQVSNTYGSGYLTIMKQLASDIQSRGVVGDEKILTGLNSLGASGMSADDAMKLIEGITDYAVRKNGLDVTEENMDSYAQTFAKAINNGTAKTLINLGLAVDSAKFKSANKQQRIEMVQAALQAAGFSGANSAAASTDAGKAQQVSNQIGDVKEEIGKWIQKIYTRMYEIVQPFLPVLQRIGEQLAIAILDLTEQAANWLYENQDKVIEFLNELPDKIKEMAENVANIAKWLFNNMGGIKNTLLAFTGINMFANLATVIGSGISAYKSGNSFLNKILSRIVGNSNYFARSASDMAVKAAACGNPAAYGMYREAAEQAQKAAKATALQTSRFNIFGKVAFILKEKFAELSLKLQMALFNMGKFGDIVWKVMVGLSSFLRVLAPIAGIAIYYKKLFDYIWNSEGGTAESVLGENARLSHYNMGEKALGTPYFRGGLTSINERGGEIVDLPSGTRIIPNDISKQMMGGITNNVSVNINGNVIGNKQYAEELGEYITNRIKLAMVVG